MTTFGSRVIRARTWSTTNKSFTIVLMARSGAKWRGKTTSRACSRTSRLSWPDDRIFSYGVSVRDPRYLEECSLNTRDATERTCRPLQIGGKPLLLPASCNYVGAAVGPSGHKLVWWTTVEANGSEGQWSYIYESHNEWSGPIVSGHSTATTILAISIAAFSNERRVSLAGQLYAGAYPQGRFALGCAEFSLGETIHCTAFTKDMPVSGKAASDIWLHNGGTHVIAETHNSSIAYYYKPPQQSWANCQVATLYYNQRASRSFFGNGKACVFDHWRRER